MDIACQCACIPLGTAAAGKTVNSSSTAVFVLPPGWSAHLRMLRSQTLSPIMNRVVGLSLCNSKLPLLPHKRLVVSLLCAAARRIPADLYQLDTHNLPSSTPASNSPSPARRKNHSVDGSSYRNSPQRMGLAAAGRIRAGSPPSFASGGKGDSDNSSRPVVSQSLDCSLLMAAGGAQRVPGSPVQAGALQEVNGLAVSDRGMLRQLLWTLSTRCDVSMQVRQLVGSCPAYLLYRTVLLQVLLQSVRW